MCVSLTAMTLAQGLSIAGTAVSAFGSIQAGRQDKAMANYQAEQASADADAARAQAQLEAAKIRKAGQRQQSSARAAMAASGVDIGAGTAEIINKEISSSAEEDAINAIFNGNNYARQSAAKAQAYRISGSNSSKAGFIDAGSSALRAGSKIAKGWRASVRLTDGSTFDGFL